MATQRSADVGPESRPVEISDDLLTGDFVKASGNVRLPNHIFWSGRPREFDLNSLRDRVRVYELVITEGNHDDIRFFIDPKALVELWTRIFYRYTSSVSHGKSGFEAKVSRFNHAHSSSAAGCVNCCRSSGSGGCWIGWWWCPYQSRSC
jgi:hypothetical protein